jgi:hypothetical protein
MLTKEEKAQRKSAFLALLEKRTARFRDANGRKIEWLKYRTGLNHFYLRLELDERTARLCFDLQHRDDDIRALMYEQLTEMRLMLHSLTPSEWTWIGETTHPLTGLPIARICAQNTELSYLNPEDHPPLADYLARQWKAFDEFWADARDIFHYLGR